MARYIVVKMTQGVYYNPYGLTTLWYAWDRISKSYSASIVNSDNPYGSYGTDHEFLGVATQPAYDWTAADELELQRYCDGDNLVVVTSRHLDTLLAANKQITPGPVVSTNPLHWNWRYVGGSVYKPVYSDNCRLLTTTPGGCVIKCNIQITSMSVVENLDTWDIVVNATSSFAPIEYSLDGSTWQISNVLPVGSEGTYTVYVKDSNDCTANATIQVVAKDFLPRYVGTMRDNSTQLWTAVIDEKGYTGESEEITLMNSGVKIKWNQQGDNKLAAIKGSEARVSVNSETNMQFIDLFTAEANKFRFSLVKGVFLGYANQLANNSFNSGGTGWTQISNSDDVAWTFPGTTAYVAIAGFKGSGRELFQNIILLPGKYILEIAIRVFNPFDQGVSVYRTLGSGFDYVLDVPSSGTSIADAEYTHYRAEFTVSHVTTGFGVRVFGNGNDFNPFYVEMDYISIKPYNEVVWFGMIAPEAYEEPYLDPPYTVDFTFYDGLGKLKELPLETPSGDAYSGIKSQMAALSILLAKTGLELPINVAIDLFEYRMETAVGNIPLTQAYINMDAFLQDDGTPVDCYTALQMLLSPYGAQVYQRDAEWWVVEVDMKRYDEDTRGYNYYRFDTYGAMISATPSEVEELVQHTANQDADPIRFVNAGQKMTIQPAYKEITVEAKTGVTASLNQNNNFATEGEAPVVFKYWNDTTGLLVARSISEGKSLKTIAYFEGDGVAGGYAALFSSELVDVVAGAKGARLNITINAKIESPSSNIATHIRFRLQIGPYYMDSTGNWVVTETNVDVPWTVNEYKEWKFTTKALNDGGIMQLLIFQGSSDTVGTDITGTEFKEVAVNYSVKSGRADDPILCKVTNDGKFNFKPANWKIGFGDIDHENAAFMFRNPIYLDEIGTITSEKWFRRANYVAPATIVNGGFAIDLGGWSQSAEALALPWAHSVDRARVDNLNEFDLREYSTFLYQQLTNPAGPVRLTFKAYAGFLYAGDELNGPVQIAFSYGPALNTGTPDRLISLPIDVYETQTIEFDAPENVVIAFRLIFTSYPSQIDLDDVAVEMATIITDTSFLGSLDGLTIQQNLAEKLMNAYVRPMQLINGVISCKDRLLRMGNIFRDTYNQSGQDYMITYLAWDVMMRGFEVELVEFLQLNILDTWLLTEGEENILTENLIQVQEDY
jgi:hypothetical protein